MAISDVIAFVRQHSSRGACMCGRCFDSPANPGEHQPTGHTVDLIFFKVSAVDNPDAGAFRQLLDANHAGDFLNVDLFDGYIHDYRELGAWIGDQGIALQLIGLGELLGLWRLLTPRSMFGNDVTDEQAMQLAQNGFVAMKHDKGTSHG